MHWWKQFKPSSCNVQIKAVDKDGALAEVVNHLVKAGALAEELSESALKALRERELVASTGVGMNVAIPHVKLKGLERAVCALSVHREGLEWAAVDGMPVTILFTILRPEDAGADYNPEDHLEMMRWIAKVAREGDFRRFALEAKTKTDLVDLLKEMSTV